MSDPRELRRTRLENEYRELMSINGPIIQIEPLGDRPYEKYRITYNIRTIVSPAPTYRNKTVCIMTIPAAYPSATGAPSIFATETPYPWHINWFVNGKWCSAYYTDNFNASESLVNFVLRCARVLQFDPTIANRNSVANSNAVAFWDSNCRNKRIMPCDTQILPVPNEDSSNANARRGSDNKISILSPQKPKITIHTSNEKPKITIL